MERRLLAMKMNLRHDLYVLVQSSLRSPRPSKKSDFEMTMTRNELKVSCSCDLELFSF